MKLLKTFILYTFLVLALSACTPIVYNSAKNSTEQRSQVASEKLAMQKPFVLFDFSKNLGENKVIISALKSVLKESKITVDPLIIDPLSFLSANDIENKISNFNPDVIIVVTPLQNFVGLNKGGYYVADLNYLVETRKTYQGIALKKCTISLNSHQFTDNSLIEDAATMLRKFFSN